MAFSNAGANDPNRSESDKLREIGRGNLQIAQTQVDVATRRTQQAEQSRLAVHGLLGRPGTFGEFNKGAQAFYQPGFYDNSTSQLFGGGTGLDIYEGDAGFVEMQKLNNIVAANLLRDATGGNTARELEKFASKSKNKPLMTSQGTEMTEEAWLSRHGSRAKHDWDKENFQGQDPDDVNRADAIAWTDDLLRKSGVSPKDFSDEAKFKFALDPKAGPHMKEFESKQARVGEKISRANYADVLDPSKYADFVAGTPEFELVSFLTNEASDLAKQQGARFQEINDYIKLPIYEGAAALSRESEAEMNRNFAKGGSARRGAVKDALRMRQQESINRDRSQALATSNMAMVQWGQENARTQLNFNQSWVDNLGGVRDVYNAAMNDMAKFYGEVMLPAAQDLAQTNYLLSIKESTNVLGIIIGANMAIAGAISSYWTGGAGMAVAAQGTAMAMGSIAGQSNVQFGGPSASQKQAGAGPADYISAGAGLLGSGIEAWGNRSTGTTGGQTGGLFGGQLGRDAMTNPYSTGPFQ